MEFEKDLSAEFNRHLYDPKTLVPNEKAEVIPADKIFQISNKLSDTIPAYGMAVYTTVED